VIVTHPEHTIRNIPDLIKTEFRLTNSQIARLSQGAAELRRDVGELQRDVAKLRDLPEKVDALQGVMAEFVVEIRAEIGKKG